MARRPQFGLLLYNVLYPVQKPMLIHSCGLFRSQQPLLNAPSYAVKSQVPSEIFSEFVANLFDPSLIELTAENVGPYSELANEFQIECLRTACDTFSEQQVRDVVVDTLAAGGGGSGMPATAESREFTSASLGFTGEVVQRLRERDATIAVVQRTITELRAQVAARASERAWASAQNSGEMLRALGLEEVEASEVAYGEFVSNLPDATLGGILGKATEIYSNEQSGGETDNLRKLRFLGRIILSQFANSFS
jgi:hypothetical protein